MATHFAESTPQEVQLVPVDIKGCSEEYLVLVATKLIRCIDDQASEAVQVWSAEDGLPGEPGHCRGVRGMRIDPRKVGGDRVFRTWGWPDALIVSEHIKWVLERARLKGAAFEEVRAGAHAGPGAADSRVRMDSSTSSAKGVER